MKSKYKSGRSVFALIVVCLVIFSFAADLFNIQVKNNEYYAAQNNTESKYFVELEDWLADIAGLYKQDIFWPFDFEPVDFDLLVDFVQIGFVHLGHN